MNSSSSLQFWLPSKFEGIEALIFVVSVRLVSLYLPLPKEVSVPFEAATFATASYELGEASMSKVSESSVSEILMISRSRQAPPSGMSVNVI